LAEKNLRMNASTGMNKKETPDLNTQIGPNIGLQINTSGYHPAKRENNQKTGHIDVNDVNSKMKNGTEYWQSTQQNSYEAWRHPELARGSKPEWTYHNPAYVTQYKIGASEYRFSYGDYGSDPREKLPSTLSKQEKREDTLKLGSTECTRHPPGYTGFIPNTTISYGRAIDQAKGSQSRTTFIKNNITENFHRQIPGYAGHKPRAAINDRGDIRDSIYFANENAVRDV